ncbi:MAG: thioredoxin-dependent thiol peroxidase [archaeon]|nr:thioredoxin-dependent thiol peroxidase [archaeon]
MMEKGDTAPDFELSDSTGKIARLSDFRGKIVAIYFYPKDFTPGCTTQACNLRDNFAELKKNGVVVLGISTDEVDSHKRFGEKYSLPFELLADVGARVSKSYGVFVEKNFAGKKFFGIKRTTFVVGKDGKILGVIGQVKTEDHARQILGVLEKN